MRIGTWTAALASIEHEKRMDVIANNLANVTTPGYKKDDVKFEDYIYETTYTKWDQGPVESTGNSFDVAILGEGYFRVQNEEGVLYTRAGNLTKSADNTLVTPQGWTVLGKNGPIQVESSDVRIERDGQVFDAETGEAVDTIDVVQFPEDTRMVKVKGNCFKPADDDAQPIAAQNYTVQQGAVEGANFSLVEEMAKMVEATRLFEAYQKVLQTNEQDLDSKLISKLST